MREIRVARDAGDKAFELAGCIREAALSVSLGRSGAGGSELAADLYSGADRMLELAGEGLWRPGDGGIAGLCRGEGVEWPPDAIPSVPGALLGGTAEDRIAGAASLLIACRSDRSTTRDMWDLVVAVEAVCPYAEKVRATIKESDLFHVDRRWMHGPPMRLCDVGLTRKGRRHVETLLRAVGALPEPDAGKGGIDDTVAAETRELTAIWRRLREKARLEVDPVRAQAIGSAADATLLILARLEEVDGDDAWRKIYPDGRDSEIVATCRRVSVRWDWEAGRGDLGGTVTADGGDEAVAESATLLLAARCNEPLPLSAMVDTLTCGGAERSHARSVLRGDARFRTTAVPGEPVELTRSGRRYAEILLFSLELDAYAKKDAYDWPQR